ncbi:hypothetical protein ACJMK2_024225 [Sinanodonta woodiana]|uniref:SPIN-DOC-like zinc-finger domain-containing protein n=1 Tax=Sinanodonta woodiana TaxID=1069815 RepID=A0ABD3T8J0_SINWO
MLNNNKKRTRTYDAEGRIFQERWELNYFFVEHRGAPVCLICNESVAIMKVYNLRCHYETRHNDDFGKFEGRMREDKLASLKRNLAASPAKHFLKIVSRQTDAAMKASYEVAFAIAKQGKPFTDGEFVKSCMMKVVEHICSEKKELFGTISLSKQTGTRRVEHIASILHQQLERASEKFIWYSHVLNESTDVSNTAKLLIFIRGVDETLQLQKTLPDSAACTTRTKVDMCLMN